MAENNATILNSVWLAGSTAYQQNVPRCTQGNIAQTVAFLSDPMNRNYFNEFVSTLVNRIARTVVRNRSWQNPLARFKGENLGMGQTVQEIGMNLVKGRCYQDCGTQLFDCTPPDALVAYHSVNRENMYPIDIVEPELRKAFSDELGIDAYINGVLDVPIRSDNRDEYRSMMQLFAEFEQDWGFYKMPLADINAEDDPQKASLKALASLQTVAGRMQYVDGRWGGKFNAYHLPVSSEPGDMVLFATPDIIAAINVYGYAPTFNWDKARSPFEVVQVDEFPVKGARAVLADKDWFVVHDYLYETNEFYDPSTLRRKSMLHHWQVVSASPMLNAIMFGDFEEGEPTKITVSVSGATLDIAEVDGAKPEFATPGENLQLAGSVTGSVAPETDGIYVPQGAYFAITASDVELDPQTYVTNDGVLHVSPDEKAKNVTVTMTAAYLDPDTKLPQERKTAEVTVGIGSKYEAVMLSDGGPAIAKPKTAKADK